MLKITGWTALLAAGIGSTVFRGFTIATLWGWFVVPLGVPAIGIAIGIGISVLVSLLTFNVAGAVDPGLASKTSLERGTITSISGFVLSAMSLLVGWVVTFFM